MFEIQDEVRAPDAHVKELEDKLAALTAVRECSGGQWSVGEQWHSIVINGAQYVLPEAVWALLLTACYDNEEKCRALEVCEAQLHASRGHNQRLRRLVKRLRGGLHEVEEHVEGLLGDIVGTAYLEPTTECDAVNTQAGRHGAAAAYAATHCDGGRRC